MSIKPCDQDVFDKGQSVCLVDIPKETAENICRSLSAETGYKIDWHYIGGRVHIKALAAQVVERQPFFMKPQYLTVKGLWIECEESDPKAVAFFTSPPAPGEHK